MSVILCPGVHLPELTEGFLAGLNGQLSDCLIYPADRYPPFSAYHILQFLRRQLSNPVVGANSPCADWRQALQEPLLFISFSAGVVGAIGAAQGWQQLGGQVKALIALDGWGVPLYASFPLHRLSHDRFTHWSSALLGAGADGFYADPPVSHLELWQFPHQVTGFWQHSSDHLFSMTTAADFLLMLLDRYGESS